jgi:hypothetical protein
MIVGVGVAVCMFGRNFSLKILSELSMMVHACNPSTWEAEAGGSGVQPGPHSEVLSEKFTVN